MPLITRAYFIDTIQLPGFDATDVTSGAYLDRLIAKYEPEFLRKALGVAFYDAIVETPDDYTDLMNGESYSVDGKVYFFGGLANATTLTSPIANYIYWIYKRNTATRTDNTGESITQVENATVVSPIQKQVTAWNDMVDMLRSMRHYLNNNEETYPLWDSCNMDRDLLCLQNFLNV